MSDISPLCQRLKLYKMTTPPWKDTFRKNCLERIRDNRRRLMDGKRHLNTADEISSCVGAEWSKLSQDYGVVNLDEYLPIYEEILAEATDEGRRIFEEYEHNCKFMVENQCTNLAQQNNFGGSRNFVFCSNCGRRNSYASGENRLFLNEQLTERVDFCQCGKLSVDRRTKVLEPMLTVNDVYSRIDYSTSQHGMVCASTPVIRVLDSGPNDGDQLILSCPECNMNLITW